MRDVEKDADLELVFLKIVEQLRTHNFLSPPYFIDFKNDLRLCYSIYKLKCGC